MKLTVITVNLNNCQGLQKTIESVTAQTFKDFEWIVIDGGSTDGSKELIEQNADRISYWVSESDKGVYNAMNKGVKAAQGEYINFMNSGDCFASSTILDEVFSTNHTADVLYGYMMRDCVDGEINNAYMMKPHISWIDLYREGLPHQSTFIKRTLFEELGGYDEQLKVSSDWKFFVNALVYHKSSSEFVPKKISIYASGGLSDREGRLERECLKKELFPSAMVANIPIIESFERMRKFKLTNWMYSVIDKMARKMERMHKL